MASLAPWRDFSGGEESGRSSRRHHFSPNENRGARDDLIIKVNGVRIACRGGNWGMDDSRKRVSRDTSNRFSVCIATPT